jgi:type VI protein secretion system component VasK
VSQVFSKDGFRELAPAWTLLAGAVVAAVAIVAGSHWYYERERREGANAGQRMSQARARVDGARRERENLQASAETFRTLVDRGLLAAEQRLDMVELVNSLRTRHQLFALDYEIGPQRPLTLGNNRVYPSMDVLASRVKLKARALHEGDLLAFMNELTEGRQGFYPVDRCVLRRLEAGDSALQPRVEAECALEWITLKEKRGG